MCGKGVVSIKSLSSESPKPLSFFQAASRLNAASLDKAVTGGSGGVPTAFKSNNALLPFWSGGHIDVVRAVWIARREPG